MKVLKRRILVLGASGVLGRRICGALKEVLGDFLELHIGDNKEARGLQTVAAVPCASFRLIDSTNLDSILTAIQDIDCVIVAFRQVEPVIQQACFLKEVICIDTSTMQSLTDKILKLDTPRNSLSIVMAGFLPGLSGILVDGLTREFDSVHQIDVGLLQNGRSEIGAAGLRDTLKILSTPLESGQAGMANLREMGFFHTKYPVREINPDERLILQKRTKVNNIHYWIGWNRPKYAKLLAFLVKHQQLSKLQQLIQYATAHRKHGEEGRSYLTVEVNGIMHGENHSILMDISAKSDYESTAFYIAMIADKSFISKKKGLCYPFEVMEMNDFNYFDYDPYLKIKRYEQELD